MSETKLANSGVYVNDTSVQELLRKYMLVDGYNITLDLAKSKGSYIHDSNTNKNFLDFFTFVASNPIGLNHPKMMTDEFINEIGKVALTKPSLSDIYVREQGEFVDTFFKTAVPSYFKYAFFIEGGALAVENALKAAIDWKVQKNFQKGYKEEKGKQIIHFKQAFHGRTGYTLSLTNTDPIKIKYFPKFDWPRITNPKVKFPLEGENLAEVIRQEDIAIGEIKDAIAKNKDDIAGLIIEAIQGEGGDNQFRKEFFVKLREICDENEIIFIIDEVQTGIAMTGKWWAHMHYVQPDIISFGKKMQVCGILSTGRIDEIETNVFKIPSRINSTWGGNIVDMVRSRRILEIIEEDNLVENAEIMGKYLLSRIHELQNKYAGKVSNGRGVGLFAAFDLDSAELRNKTVSESMNNNLLILGCGEKSIRFRPNLAINSDEIDECFVILDKVIGKLV